MKKGHSVLVDQHKQRSGTLRKMARNPCLRWYGWTVSSPGVPMEGLRGEVIVLCQVLECLQ